MSNNFKQKLASMNSKNGGGQVVVEGVETASFKYSIMNGDMENPHLFVDIDKFDEKCLSALAYLLASISHENFIYHILSYIEKGFAAANQQQEFMKLLGRIQEEKDKISEKSDEVYISPIKLSGG